MRKIMKKWLLHILSLALGLGVVVMWLHAAGWARIGAVLANIWLPGLAVGLLMYATSWAARTGRMAGLLPNPVPGTWELFRINTAGFAVNNLLPARLGEVATVLLLLGRRVSWPTGAAVVVQTRVLDFFILILAILCTWVWPKSQTLPAWIHWSGLIAIFIGLLVFLTAMRWVRGKGTFRNQEGSEEVALNFKQRVYRGMKRVATAYTELLVPVSRLGKSVAGTLLVWGFEIATTYFVALSLGHPLAWYICLLAVVAANLAKALPITPGGLGVYESAFSGILLWAHVPMEAAVTIALADHLFKKAFVLSFGIPGIFSYGLHWRELWEARKSAEKPIG